MELIELFKKITAVIDFLPTKSKDYYAEIIDLTIYFGNMKT